MKTLNFILCCFLLTGSLFAQVQKGQTTVPTDDVIVLNDEEKEIFRQETLKKIKSFQGHLSFIASKDNSNEDKQIYKELALDNFINKGKGVTMEVSYLSPITKEESRKRLPLIQYLDNLANLNYAKVELKTAKSCVVSNWIKSGVDENGIPVYSATATYYQEFIGYNKDGVAVYKDLTQKTVKVEIRYTTDLDGSRWIISLGDISVAETT